MTVLFISFCFVLFVCLFFIFSKLFGSYLSAKAAGSPPAVDENQQLLWRDGILTRVIKQLEELENMKGRIKHPDADSTLNAVSP